MIKEFKPIKRPTAPMPLDVKIELGYLMHNNFSADRVFQDCVKLVKTGKSDFVSSEIAADWIVKYETVFCRAFIERWDLDDPPKYWIGE